MKGRGGSSTFVRRFSSVSLPRPVVLIVLIYITPFKLCCPSGLKSNQGSWGRNECLGFDPGSRTEASFGCSQSGQLCCLQHKRRVRQTLFACDTLFWYFWYFFFIYVRLVRCAVGWTMQAKRQSPQVPQPKAFLLIWYTWSLLFASEFVDDLASTWHTAGRKRNSCRGSHFFCD